MKKEKMFIITVANPSEEIEEVIRELENPDEGIFVDELTSDLIDEIAINAGYIKLE